MEKNRYMNVYANENTIFPKVDKNSKTYINANYIHDVILSTTESSDAKEGEDNSIQPHFIACQAPLPHILPDFYETVYEHNIHLILMVTSLTEKGILKADRYWPKSYKENGTEENELQEADLSNICDHFDDFVWSASPENDPKRNETVKKTRAGNFLLWNDDTLFPYRQDTKLQLVERVFFVQKVGNEKILKVRQVQYVGWPDHGIPLVTDSFDALLRLITNYKNAMASNDAYYNMIPPVMVHCSAGIGRTGTLLAAYTALEVLGNKERDAVTPFRNDTIRNIVVSLRQKRFGMVQTFAQYCFIYLVVLKYIKESRGGLDAFDAEGFTDYINKNCDAAQMAIYSAIQNNPMRNKKPNGGGDGNKCVTQSTKGF
ncbi:tyrosine specific protein phosphatase [Angomonas deanei]|nr:tyrosine specific protein phosphatase [Angomonas deanei]EPY39584.1 tyrosine specific protein phosphatase [Angomonas deanei]|eukprot:EPY24915.1 tyrosine specific protein phosphatase [Angomonas deanei]